jgi:hypothetical protein
MRSSAIPLWVALIFVGTGAAAQPPCDLTDDWICGGNCQRPGGRGHITQSGSALSLIGDTGGVTQGYWLPDSTTIVNIIDPAKNIELQGNVNKDCNLISWQNPTYWVRQKQQPKQ